MIILIAGASYVGKTLMAQNLLEKYKIPYLSLDHLKMGLFRSGQDFGFTPESAEKIITEKLWPIVKGIIMTNIENGQNLIIEGCYFPERIDDLAKKYLDEIIFLHLIFSEKYIRENLFGKIYENKTVIEKRTHEPDENFLPKYIQENKNNKEKCLRNNLKYFEINNDYETEIQSAYSWLEEEIKKGT